MSSLDKIADELKALMYETSRSHSPSRGEVVVIEYKILEGKYKGKCVWLGFSFHGGEEAYPEYPPHWIHISPPHDDGGGGSVESYTTSEHGQEKHWVALSRPPSDFWDKLPTKHMSQYLHIHVSRFCERLK